jgi:hypothetical protein
MPKVGNSFEKTLFFELDRIRMWLFRYQGAVDI